MAKSKPSSVETMLAGVKLFERLDKKQLRHLSEIVDVVSVNEGKELIREGGLGRELMVIVEGGVDVRRGGETIAQLGPGSAVGEMALLDHQEASATVVATTASEIIVIDGRRFIPLLEEMPGLAASLLATVSARLREADRAYDV